MIMDIILTVVSICWIESNHRNVINEDDGGSPSYGQCQVKLNTAKMFKKDITIKELMEPYINFTMATKYYMWQLKRYNNNVDCAISAYNAGRCIINVAEPCFTKKGNTKPCPNNIGYVNKVKLKLKLYRRRK